MFPRRYSSCFERKKVRKIVYFLNNSILIYSQDSTIVFDTSTADLKFEGTGIYSWAELKGTARIGLKALFPTQGPHAASIPTATDNNFSFRFNPGKAKTLSFVFFIVNVQCQHKMAGGVEGGGRGGGGILKSTISMADFQVVFS